MNEYIIRSKSGAFRIERLFDQPDGFGHMEILTEYHGEDTANGIIAAGRLAAPGYPP